MNFNLILKKKRVCVLSGNRVLVVNKKITRKKRTASHNAQPTNDDARRRERRFALPRARRRQPLLFLVAQDRKLSFSGCLGWAEEALKRHVRNSSGDAAIEISSVFSVVLLVCSVFAIVGRSSRPKNWDCGRHDYFGGATAGVRCAMVYGCGRGY